MLRNATYRSGPVHTFPNSSCLGHRLLEEMLLALWKTLMSHQRCRSLIIVLLPCWVLRARDAIDARQWTKLLGVAQFLKGQKVFALTDGRLFWRKEGRPDMRSSQQ